MCGSTLSTPNKCSASHLDQHPFIHPIQRFCRVTDSLGVSLKSSPFTRVAHRGSLAAAGSLSVTLSLLDQVSTRALAEGTALGGIARSPHHQDALERSPQLRARIDALVFPRRETGGGCETRERAVMSPVYS